VNKVKGIELYKERKRLGLKIFFTVHDEWDMQVPDKKAAEEVEKILNRQSFDLRVPILWEVGTGNNWKEAKAA
jgi:DNA polymerase I - 3''-5'' exonuclease and polymerase domains